MSYARQCRERPEAQAFREQKLASGFQIGRMTWSNLHLDLGILEEEREFVTGITMRCGVHHDGKYND
jgi:hypothetical protein